MSISAIIPAAGIGSRFSKEIKKQFFEIDNKPVLYYTLLNLSNAYSFDKFIIGAREDDFIHIENVINSLNLKNVLIVEGGSQRSDTVYNCLNKNKSNFILIHDAVRPFVKKEIIINVINDAFAKGASICALPVRDTVKQIDNNFLNKTIDRNKLILSHTPQVFKAEILNKALAYIDEHSIQITDEAMAFEIIGEKVSWVMSNPENIKITYSQDMELIQILFKKFNFK